MRVLLVSHSSAVGNLGGAELSLLHLIDKWKKLRPEVEFAVVSRTPGGLLQAEVDRRGVPHQLLDFDSWVLPLVRIVPEQVLGTARMDSNAVLWLVDFMREFKPDVVVTNTIVAPWAAIAAKHLKIVHVWMVHEYGDLDHGLGFRIGRARTFEDIGMLSELVVANSEAVRDHIAAWIPTKKTTVAYPAIDLEKARASAAIPSEVAIEHPALDGALNTIMVGRLAPSKGQWRLLRAIAQLRDEGIPVTATLVGGTDTADARDVLALADTLGLGDRVVAIGEVGNPFAAITHADVGVTASDCEAFGRVTIEYMALGKAVIASNSGASPELVSNGKTGWLFDAGSIDDLARVLKEAYSDRTELSRRGSAALASVESGLAEAHPIEAMVERIEQTVRVGALPITHLPNLTREWIELPRVVESYLSRMHELRTTAHNTTTWRAGRFLLGPFRALALIAGRRIG